jgi:ankyrin repeat protein
MFPNPQSALPLPPRPRLERYRKLAKELVKACRSADGMALDHCIAQWVQMLAKLCQTSLESGEVKDYARRQMAEKCSLTAAQFVIARAHGFESWPKFSRHLEALAQTSSPVSRFEAAADAIVNGDAAALESLLLAEQGLARARSNREHRAALLHYVSANGVESYRQKTPRNIAAITQMLLNAGAEIDAAADVYGDGCTTLGLAATSIHPERAGVQEALLQVLLDHGANLEQPNIGGNGQSLVTACLANGRLKAAEFLAARGASLDLAAAAGLGRLDMVQGFFGSRGESKTITTRKQMETALLCACAYGRNTVVEFLLEKGAPLAAHSADGQTALHHAVIGGHPDTVTLILRHNPPIAAQNIYGGSVLGQAHWSAAHGGDPNIYAEIVKLLVAAGAK